MHIMSNQKIDSAVRNCLRPQLQDPNQISWLRGAPVNRQLAENPDCDITRYRCIVHHFGALRGLLELLIFSLEFGIFSVEFGIAQHSEIDRRAGFINLA